MKITFKTLLLSGIVAVTTAGVAHANIVPVSATASSFTAGWEAINAIDTGANKLSTDWDGNNSGVGTYLNLDLGVTYNLTSVVLTDRTSSGAGNGSNAFGTYDFTTSFSLQAYTSASFTTAIGSAIVFNKSTPTSPTSAADFTYTGTTTGLTGEFIRYTVLAANGANPGLADIGFTGSIPVVVVPTIPEPVSLAILGVGLLGLAAIRRRA